MIRKRNITCALAAVALLVAATIPLCGSALAAERQSGTTSSYYHEKQMKYPDSYIGAKSLTGEWAGFTTIGGNTLEDQLDNKIAYLNTIYEQQQERFIIEEGIAQSEITNMEGPVYLYQNSSLYRQMVTGDTVTIATGGSFSMLSDVGHNSVCERYVFNMEGAAKFELNAQYTMQEGKLALWVVSPDGDALYHNQATNSFDQSISLNLKKGLHSIVLEYHMKDSSVKGEKTIVGTVK